MWEMLTLVANYLKHLKTLSTFLSGATYTTLLLVIIGLNMILDKTEKLDDSKLEKSSWDVTILLAILKGRNKILKHYYKQNWIYCAILILDTWYKVQTFSLTSWGQDIGKGVPKKFEEIYRKYSIRRRNWFN